MTIGQIQNQNDTGLGSKDYRPPVDPSVAPIDGQILVYSEAEQAFLPQDGVTTAGFNVTDDAGNGSVSDDCNNTDFTGQSPIVGQAANLKIASVNTFVHKTVAYNWVGPTGVTVGIGGSYTATPSDFVGIGTADHAILVNLDVADQHPISAITGLVNEQIAQDDATAQVQTNLDTHEANTSNPHVTRHAQLGDASDPDLHPTSSISGLDTKQQAQDDATAQVQTNLDAHVAAPDPHPQYAQETAVLDNFVGAGYGGIGQNANTSLPNLGTGWITYTGFDTTILINPRYVTQDFANNGLIFQRQGVWLITVKVTIAHNSSNTGREVNLRFFNANEGSGGATTFAFGIGRNVEVTNLSVPAIPIEIAPDQVGDLYQIQLGGTSDTVSSVTALGGFFTAVHVSEFQGL